jgi:ferredoxin
MVLEGRTEMKYKVNDACIGCGVCEATCPDVFFMNDDGLAEAKNVDTDDEAAAEAKEACPTSAIEEA